MKLQSIGLLTLAFAFTPGGAAAQSLIEHAAVAGPAAIGSSTGALIGATLSSTLGATAEAAADPDGSGKGVQTTSVTVIGAGKARRSSVAAPGAFTHAARGTARPVRSRRAGPIIISHNARPAGTHDPLPPAVAERPRLSREQLLERLDSVAAGESRSDMIRTMGSPDCTIAMGDNAGRYVERMRFRANGDDVAVVELRDGVVMSVAKIAR